MLHYTKKKNGIRHRDDSNYTKYLTFLDLPYKVYPSDTTHPPLPLRALRKPVLDRRGNAKVFDVETPSRHPLPSQMGLG